MASEWNTLPLGEVLELVIDHRGKTPKKLGFDDFHEAGYPVLSAKHVKTRGLINVKSIRYANQVMYEKWMKTPLKKGDVILTSEAPMGETYYIDGSVQYVLGQRVFGLRPKTELIDPLYLLTWLSSDAGQTQLHARATGSTVQGIKQSELLKIEIEVPPLAVQKIISKNQSSFSAKVQLNQQINQTLEQMAQAIFKSWFVDFDPVRAKMEVLEAGGSEQDALLAAMQAISGKDADQLGQLQTEQYAELKATADLFPSAMQDSEFGEIPEGWESAPLSKLFELHRGFDLPQKSREEGSYEVYAAGGLHGTHSQYKMEPPGIITGRSGVIGNVYLSLKKYWPLNTTLYVREFRSCGPYYAYHLLKTLDLKSLNSGSAVPSLNRNFVHSIAVLNPGSAVLNKFESLSSSLFEQVVQNIDQSELLSTLRDSLLPKLLSGELTFDPNEADEVATA